jgi:hypothetical protein
MSRPLGLFYQMEEIGFAELLLTDKREMPVIALQI